MTGRICSAVNSPTRLPSAPTTGTVASSLTMMSSRTASKLAPGETVGTSFVALKTSPTFISSSTLIVRSPMCAGEWKRSFTWCT